MNKLTLEEILNGRKLAQKSIPICMRLDVLADIEEAERAITAAQGNAVDDLRMTGSDDVPELVDRIRELEEIAKQYTIDLRLQAVERTEWKQKVDEFTTEDDDGNAKLDIAALTVDIFPQSLVSPAMGADQQKDFLLKLSEGQWEKVMNAVFDLNRRTVDVGKSLTASLVSRPKSEKRGPVGQ